MQFLNTLVFSNKAEWRILRHTLYWSFACISILVAISADFEVTFNIILSRFLVIPLPALITYFIIYYLIPSYSKDRNLVKLIVGIFFAVIFLAIGVRYFRLGIINPLFDIVPTNSNGLWSFSRVVRDMFRWVPSMCLAIAIKMVKNRHELQQRTQQLIEEKKATELAFLKAQMNPHFLFNTLNTLYSQAIKTKDPNEQVIMQLSNLMRFILEECDKRAIPIESEIKVISDYFELKKLRHGERLQVELNVKSDGSPSFISPLLMLPIVENSCKHSVAHVRGPVNVKVNILSSQGYINLQVENDVGEKEDVVAHHGRGLYSVRKQLQLVYGKDFQFETKREDGKFLVYMKVPSLKLHEQNQLHYH